MSDLVEIVARSMTRFTRPDAFEAAQQAFDAIEKSGHRIVPVEPTDEMCAAAERIWPADEAYRAMLAAAPKVTHE